MCGERGKGEAGVPGVEAEGEKGGCEWGLECTQTWEAGVESRGSKGRGEGSTGVANK